MDGPSRFLVATFVSISFVLSWVKGAASHPPSLHEVVSPSDSEIESILLHSIVRTHEKSEK